MNEHVRESIKQVDADTWLVGPLKLHRSEGYSETSTWYDQDNLSYTLTDAPTPRSSTVPLPADDPTFKLVYDVGDAHAVWSIGNCAFCKVVLCEAGTTREAATLAFVSHLHPDFEVPKVLYNEDCADRSYLFLSRVRGRTLSEAWPTLDEKWRRLYTNAIVDACRFLEKQESDILCGVDGKQVAEQYLIKIGTEFDYSPKSLQKTCESIVEDIPKAGTIGIIDWDVAGYFPRGWTLTKFRVSGGLDLPDAATDDPPEWRRGLSELLGQHGFEDYVPQWVSWSGLRL